MFMRHFLDVQKKVVYESEIRGAFVVVGTDEFNWEKFNETTRVKTRFSAPFAIVCDSFFTAAAAAAFASDMPENSPAVDPVASARTEI